MADTWIPDHADGSAFGKEDHAEDKEIDSHVNGFTNLAQGDGHLRDPLDVHGSSTYWNDGNGSGANRADAYWHIGHNLDGTTPNFDTVVSKTVGIDANNRRDSEP